MGCVWAKIVGLYEAVFRCSGEQAVTQSPVDGDLENKSLMADKNTEIDNGISDKNSFGNDDDVGNDQTLDKQQSIIQHTLDLRKRNVSHENCTEPSNCNGALHDNGIHESKKLDVDNSDLVQVIESKDVDQCHDDFEDLLSRCPSTVVLKILGYLSYKDLVHSVSPVCKSWHNMAFDPSLWCVIDFRRYKFYQVGSKLSDDVFIAFAENCPRLKKFVLECLEITDKTVLSIAHNLHDLEHLSVSQISNISNEAVAEVIKCCRKLKLLKISHNKQITEKCLVTIPESSLSIQTLDFLMCNFNPNGIAILGELLNLEDINLSKCEDLTTDDLMPIMEGCKNLKAISLNLNKKFDDNFIDIILTKLPNMEKFYLVSTTITDEALVIMGKKGKKISVIDIGYTKVTGFGARYVSENCACLEYLGLIRCDSVPEEEVEKLVVEYPHIMYSTFIQDTKRMFAKIERDGRLD